MTYTVGLPSVPQDFFLQPTSKFFECGRISHDLEFRAAYGKQGNNQGPITVPWCSLCGFLLLYVPCKCLKFRFGLHSTPTRFRHIYLV
jgi:hypothetical protein